MPNSKYGESTYGSSFVYGGVESTCVFRYRCGLQVEKDRLFRYDSLGAVGSDCIFRYSCPLSLDNTVKFRYNAGGWHIISRKFRHSAKQGVLNNRSFRYKSTQGVRCDRKFRYSNSRTVSDRSFRYGALLPIVKDKYFRYTALTELYETVSGGNPSGNPNSGGGGTIGYPYVNPLQGYLYANGTPIPESNDLGLASFGVTFTESSPAKWALHILDTTGDYNPANQASPWYGVMTDESYDANDNLVKWIRSGLTYGGQPFEFVGVPTDYSWEQDSFTRYFNFVWQGEDKTEILFRESHTFETARSRLGSITTAQTIISSILSNFGFVGRFDFPDFVVPVMHMQNSKPIEFIKSLLEVVGAEWILNGDNVLHMYLPTQKQNSNWTFDLGSGNKLVQNVSVSRSMPEVINQVTISRAREVGQSTISEEEGEGNEMICEEFGVYTITFDTPLNGVYFRILESSKGQFNTHIMRNPNGDVIGVIDDVGNNYPTLHSETGYNVKSIEFNWDAGLNVIATEGYGKIRYFGTTNDSFVGSSTDVAATSEFDTAFTVVARYPASIAKHGVRKIELSPNPLIPNSEIAKITAKEYLRRVWRNRSVTKYRIPLNFMIRPGDTINEIYAQLSMNRKLYVVESSHNFSNEPSERYSVVSAVEYPQDFEVTYEVS